MRKIAVQCSATKNDSPVRCLNFTKNPDGYCRDHRSVKVTEAIRNSTTIESLRSEVKYPGIDEPLINQEVYSGVGVRTLMDAVNNFQAELAGLGMKGGLVVKTENAYVMSQKSVSTDYINVGVWEPGTHISLIHHMRHSVYNPIILQSPFNGTLVSVTSSESGMDCVSPAQMEDSLSSIYDEKCFKCDKLLNQKSSAIYCVDDTMHTVCQPCYLKGTNSKNQTLFDDLYAVVDNFNIINENQLVTKGMFDGSVIKTLANAALENISIKPDDRTALEYFRDYIDCSVGKVEPVTSYQIELGAAIESYAKLGEHSDFLTSTEKRIFECLLDPGYKESEFPEIVAAVSSIEGFDQSALTHAAQTIAFNQQPLLEGSISSPLNLRVYGEERNSGYDKPGRRRSKKILCRGVDGREYVFEVEEGMIGGLDIRKGDVVNFPAHTVGVETVEVGENGVPSHKLTAPKEEIDYKRVQICGNEERYHAYHEVEIAFSIFSKGIFPGEIVKLCVDCGRMERT